MLYEKIPNAPQSNFTIPPSYGKEYHANDGMIGSTNTHTSTASNPAPSSKIHAMSSDKGKSDKQLRIKKKGKVKKKQNSTSQERSSDQHSRSNWKPCYPCLTCNEENFF